MRRECLRSKKMRFFAKTSLFRAQITPWRNEVGQKLLDYNERAWFEVSENYPKFDPSPFGHGVITWPSLTVFLNFTILKLNFATLNVKPQGNRWGYGARYISPIIGNVSWHSLKLEIPKVPFRGHAQIWPKIAKFTFFARCRNFGRSLKPNQ